MTAPAPRQTCSSFVVLPDQDPGCAQGHLIGLDPCPCPDYEPLIPDHQRTRCEVWSRVMGYHRPVSAWNAGKQSEHRERVNFREPGADVMPRYPWPRDPADD